MQKSKIWGDESNAVDLALDWAWRARTVSGSDPKTTFKSHAELNATVPNSITEEGLGAEEALRIYSNLLNPATRSSDDPMNLAFIPCASTRAAVAFDTVVSAANVFGGVWEMGAGAIYAENQVMDWLKGYSAGPRQHTVHSCREVLSVIFRNIRGTQHRPRELAKDRKISEWETAHRI